MFASAHPYLSQKLISYFLLLSPLLSNGRSFVSEGNEFLTIAVEIVYMIYGYFHDCFHLNL